jgi:hypothetical protein
MIEKQSDTYNTAAASKQPEGVKPTFDALLDPKSVKSRFDPLYFLPKRMTSAKVVGLIMRNDPDHHSEEA